MDREACASLFETIYLDMTERGVSLREVFTILRNEDMGMEVYGYCQDHYIDEWEKLW